MDCRVSLWDEGGRGIEREGRTAPDRKDEREVQIGSSQMKPSDFERGW